MRSPLRRRYRDLLLFILAYGVITAVALFNYPVGGTDSSPATRTIEARLN